MSNSPSSTRKPKVPSYRLHKASGQAVVTIDGRDFYLGKHGSTESGRAYDRLIAEWLATGRTEVPVGELTILELAEAYWQHAKAYYRKDGEPTTTLGSIRSLLQLLLDLYQDLPVSEFSPRCAKAVRQRMLEKDWCRGHINQQMSRLRSIFNWAVEEELIDESIAVRLSKIKGLRRGRCQAREGKPVRPVPEAFIDAVRPFVSRQVWAMIQLQLLTGMRPGEVVIMRGCDLDTSDDTAWLYTPREHKTEHHGHERVVYLGPQAQEVIRPFLKADLMAHLFSPKDAEAERFQALRAGRKTPVQPSQRQRDAKARQRAKAGKRGRAPAECYTTDSYRRAIHRACDHAFPPPESLGQREDENQKHWRARLTPEQRQELAEWRHQHRWHPHQLRHNAATELRKKFGIETARAVLGHKSTTMTEVYAEMDQAKSRQAMADVG